MVYQLKPTTQYAHDIVLTSVRRRFNVMDVVWTSKRRRVLTGLGLVYWRNLLLWLKWFFNHNKRLPGTCLLTCSAHKIFIIVADKHEENFDFFEIVLDSLCLDFVVHIWKSSVRYFVIAKFFLLRCSSMK